MSKDRSRDNQRPEGFTLDFHENEFMEFLVEATMLDRLSNAVGGSDASLDRTYARASIMNSMFAIESAANSVVRRGIFLPPRRGSKRSEGESVALAPRLNEGVENKLEPLDKFDLLCHFRGAALERSHPSVEPICDLIKVRNLLVHPKSKPKYARVTSEKGLETSEGAMHQKLKIPRRPLHWQSPHSRIVVTAVVSFLNHVLGELCMFTPRQAMQILGSGSVDAHGKEELWISIHQQRELRAIPSYYGIALGFFDPAVADAAALGLPST